MLIYMQALSVNTQKKLVWTRKLGDGGLWRQTGASHLGIF